MANLQDIRRRLRSVRNMQQITRSYKMVSAAKLRRSQDRLVAARPYANTMMRVLGRLASRAGEYKHPLLEVRGDERYVLALVTADRGLCGAFNTNLIKAAQRFIAENRDKQVELVVIGRKGRDFFRRRDVPIAGEYVNVTARTVDHADAAEIARELMRMYTEEGSTVDKVFVLYSEFKSVLSQRAVVKQLLPIASEALTGQSEPRARSGQTRSPDRLPVRAAARRHPGQPAPEIRRDAGLLRAARIGRERARRAHDGHGLGLKERGRSDRDAHPQHEPRATGVHHARDHRGRVGRAGPPGIRLRPPQIRRSPALFEGAGLSYLL